jgi:ribosomal protein S18 acetylase RimI-like enzyme
VAPDPDPAPQVFHRKEEQLATSADRTVRFVDEKFLDTYRERRHLAYLPPAGWVGGTPVHHVTPDAAVYDVDEMGKRNVCPIVLRADPPTTGIDELFAPILARSYPARLELRITEADTGVRSFLERHGFVLDRVQAGMALEIAERPKRTSEPDFSVIHDTRDGELADLYNQCFGLTLTEDDVRRMREHPTWEDRNLFAVRSGGEVVASLRLLIDRGADGLRYGFLRGLAVRPDHRRSSIPLLAAMYHEALARLVERGVGRCHMLVDRADERNGHIMRKLYSSLGFHEDVITYRMRQPAKG